MAPSNDLDDGGGAAANEIGRGTFDPSRMPTAPTPPIIVDPALAARVSRVEQMRPHELREVYRHTFGRDTASGNRAWLVRAITTRLREIDRSHRMPVALAAARAVTKDFGCEASFTSYLETMPPCVPIPRPAEDAFERPRAAEGRDRRIPPPGTVLVRHFGDRDYRVTVTEDGFMLGRHRYRSLSAVAKAITGKHWNGYLFFGLSARRRRTGSGEVDSPVVPPQLDEP
jgi:Protein of unknown function (DUF2924)